MSKEVITSNIIELLQNGENITNIILEILHTDEIKNFKTNNRCYILHGYDYYNYIPSYAASKEDKSSSYVLRNDEEGYCLLSKTEEEDFHNNKFNENFIKFMTENYPEKGFDLKEVIKKSEKKNINSENNEKIYVREYNPFKNHKRRMDYIKYLYQYGKHLLKNDNLTENNFKNILDYSIEKCGYKNLTYSEIPVNELVFSIENTERDEKLEYGEEVAIIFYYNNELITVK